MPIQTTVRPARAPHGSRRRPRRRSLLALPLLYHLLAPAGVDAAPFAYVTNRGSGDVSVIDTATGTPVGAPITVGLTPVGVGVAPGGARAYVTNFGDSTVSVLDAVTRTVTDTVSVGSQPFGAVVTPDGSRVYVTNSGAATISVVDTTDDSVMGTIVLPGVNTPTGIAVVPDGSKAYVALSGSARVAVIQTATNAVGPLIAVGANPTGVTVTPDGAYVLATNRSSGSVSVIATASNVVQATLGVGVQPTGVAVAPDGVTAYIANSGSGTVSVVDLGSLTAGPTIAVGGVPRGVALTPDGALLYVADEATDTVVIVSTATNGVIGTAATGTEPYAFGQFIEPAGCGDGALGIAEECDDGNTAGGDCCSPTCEFEPDGSPCSDGDRSTCRDECTAGVCGGAVCPDSFKCYRGEDLRQPRFLSTTAALSDDFANQSVDVRRPYLLCNPVGVDGAGITSPSEHLTCYSISAPSLTSPVTVQSQDALGSHQFRIEKPRLLCAPSSKTVLP